MSESGEHGGAAAGSQFPADLGGFAAGLPDLGGGTGWRAIGWLGRAWGVGTVNQFARDRDVSRPLSHFGSFWSDRLVFWAFREWNWHFLLVVGSKHRELGQQDL